VVDISAKFHQNFGPVFPWRSEFAGHLRPYLALVSLNDVVQWIQNHCRETRQDGSVLFLSAVRLLGGVRTAFPLFPIEDSANMRLFLKCMGFKWSNLHPAHYFVIAQRQDVVLHRSEYAPLMARLLSSRNHAVVYADGSFFYQNEHSDHAWVDLSDSQADLVPVGTGKGRRMNNWEFISPDGVLCLADGTSAGTLFPPGKTLDANDIFACVEKGIPAIVAYARAKKATGVLVIDGAKINKMLPPEAIHPGEVAPLSPPFPRFICDPDESLRWWCQSRGDAAHRHARPQVRP
jgi:hypothetical protein